MIRLGFLVAAVVFAVSFIGCDDPVSSNVPGLSVNDNAGSFINTGGEYVTDANKDSVFLALLNSLDMLETSTVARSRETATESLDTNIMGLNGYMHVVSSSTSNYVYDLDSTYSGTYSSSNSSSSTTTYYDFSPDSVMFFGGETKMTSSSSGSSSQNANGSSYNSSLQMTGAAAIKFSGKYQGSYSMNLSIVGSLSGSYVQGQDGVEEKTVTPNISMVITSNGKTFTFTTADFEKYFDFDAIM